MYDCCILGNYLNTYYNEKNLKKNFAFEIVFFLHNVSHYKTKSFETKLEL